MNNQNWICPICLDNSPQNTYILQPCQHMFHTNCIIDSLRQNGPRCPYCRGTHDSFLNTIIFLNNNNETSKVITSNNYNFKMVIKKGPDGIGNKFILINITCQNNQFNANIRSIKFENNQIKSDNLLNNLFVDPIFDNNNNIIGFENNEYI